MATVDSTRDDALGTDDVMELQHRLRRRKVSARELRDAARARLASVNDQLNAVVRDGLKKLFPDAFWVVGEVVDFDKGAGKPYRFFKLVEKSATGDAAEFTNESTR